MDELLRNGSGYVDPTAYKALKNINDKKINAGEIWEVEYHKEYRLAVVIAAQDKICNILVLNEEKASEYDIEVIAKGVKYTDPRMLSYKFNKGFVNFVRTMKEDEFETLLDVVRGSLGFNNIPDPTATVENAMVDELKMKLEEAEINFKHEKEVCHACQLAYEKAEKEIEEKNEWIAKLVSVRDDLVEEKMQLESALEEQRVDTVRMGVLAMENKKDEARELQILLERNFYKEQYEKLFERLLAG